MELAEARTKDGRTVRSSRIVTGSGAGRLGDGAARCVLCCSMLFYAVLRCGVDNEGVVSEY